MNPAAASNNAATFQRSSRADHTPPATSTKTSTLIWPLFTLPAQSGSMSRNTPPVAAVTRRHPPSHANATHANAPT